MVLEKATTYLAKGIFPGLINNKSCVNDKMVVSNLPLQIALYFNVVFAPVWTIVILLCLDKNYNSYDELYRYITITMVCTIFFVEIMRLYLGYEGNLKDKIPELAGFWMLSMLLQFPLQGFLLCNPHFRMYVLEIAVQSVMFFLLCIQLVSGYCALKYTAREQTKIFQTRKAAKMDKITENLISDDTYDVITYRKDKINKNVESYM